MEEVIERWTGGSMGSAQINVVTKVRISSLGDQEEEMRPWVGGWVNVWSSYSKE